MPLSPLFLFGLIAAAIPVVLHLLSQRNPKPYDFSTIRFIQAAMAQTRRRRRLTQILILLLRTAVIVLLVYAFSRPRVRSFHFLPEGPRTIILVLDGSGSMRCRDLEGSNYEKSRMWALEFLADLKEQDRVGVFVTGIEQQKVIFPAINKHSLVRKALKDTDCGYGRTDSGSELAGILRTCCREYPREHVELYYFSDFQASTWKGTELAEAVREAQKADFRIFLNRTGTPKAGNSWVRQADVDAAPGITEVVARAEVGADKAFTGNTVLRLDLQENEVAQMGVSIRPGDESPRTIHGAAPDQGDFITGQVTLDGDALLEDNSSYFAFKLKDHVPVLLVNGGPATAGRSDTHFLMGALNPQRKNSPLILAKEVNVGQLTGADLSAFQAVMFANPPTMTSALALKLELFVKSGGTLIVYPGNRQGLGSVLKAMKPLSAVSFKEQRYDQTQKFKVIAHDSPGELERRILGILRRKPVFLGTHRLRLVAGDDDMTTGFTMDSGAPIFVRVPVGRGEIWICAVSADRSWSDWPLHPSFVLFHQLLILENAGHGLKTDQISVGDAIAVRNTGDVLELDIDLITPDGSRQRVALQRRDRSQDFILQGFTMPGHYRLELQGGNKSVRYVAVNFPHIESKLEAVSDDKLQADLAPARVYVCDGIKQQRAILEGMTHGHALWPWLLLAAFVLSIAEELLANFKSWSRDSQNLLKDFMNKRVAE